METAIQPLGLAKYNGGGGLLITTAAQSEKD